MDSKPVRNEQNEFINKLSKSNDIFKDMCEIIDFSQKAAYQAINSSLVQRNWMIGHRIAEEEFNGEERSEYGLQIIKNYLTN